MVDAAPLPWLPAPYEFWTPKKDVTVVVMTVRFEVGLAQRSIREPPYSVIKPTLRLHVPPERKPGRPAYWDFTSLGLVHRVIEIWRRAQEKALELELASAIGILEGTSFARERPLPLLITRRVVDDEISYEVELRGTWWKNEGV